MSLLVEAMHKGGPFMVLLLLLVMLAPWPALLGAALLGARRWAPAALFWLVPLALVAAGASGRIHGQVMAAQALEHASVDVRSTLLHAGLGVAAITEWVGWAAAALSLGLTAPLMGLGLLIGSGPAAHWRPGPAILSLLACAVGAVLAVTAALLQPSLAPFGPELWVLPALLLLGGLALGLGSVRGNAQPQRAARLAAGRSAVAAVATGSLVCAALAGSLQSWSRCHEAVAMAAHDQRVALLVHGLAGQWAWLLPSALALLAVGLAGLFACGRGLRLLVRGRALLGTLLLGVGLLAAGALAGGARVQAWAMAGQSAEAHLDEQLEGVGALPRALPFGEDQLVGLPLAGFERSVARIGSGWRPGGPAEGVPAPWSLPMDDSTPQPLLLVASADTPARVLTQTRWHEDEHQPASLLVAVAHGEPPQWILGDAWLRSTTVGTVRLDHIPAEAWSGFRQGEGAVGGEIGALLDDRDPDLLPWEELLVVELGETLSLQSLERRLEGVRVPADGLAELYGGAVPGRVDLLLVPGADSDLQGLVSACLGMERGLGAGLEPWDRPAARCLVSAAPPEAFMAEVVRAQGGSQGVDGGQPDPGAGGVTGSGPAVMGSLDRDVIQRVIRRHLAQVRGCYERGLLAGPDLAGRAVVRFTVAADGRVVAASLDSSTLGDPTVEDCILGVFRRLLFPEPAGGGIVIVSYPLVFQSSG
jgi:hypothetical protein